MMNVKQILVVGLCSVVLSGCAPSYAWKDYPSLSDEELCSHAGYSYRKGSSSEVKELTKELKYRKNVGKLYISEAECKEYFQYGVMDHIEMVNKSRAFSESMDKLAEQQRASQPVTTQCNQFGSSVSCTTY